MAILRGYDNRNDTLIGGSENDVLRGLGGDDVLRGGRGNDLIEGGAGADSLVGGTGFDTVSYGASDAGVTVSLGEPQGRGSASGGHASKDASNHDTIEGFEAIVGSPHADTLTGNSEFNQLYGGAGMDTLRGGGGGDVLVGGADADVLDGGEGWDTAAYWGSSHGVTVSLVAGTTPRGGDAADDEGNGDTLRSIERIEGSAHGDTLTGDSEENALLGHDGWDMLRGGGGNDWLEGGAGRDSLYGGPDNDVLIGGADPDVLDGGSGDDSVGYEHSSYGVTVTLPESGMTSTGVGGDADRDQIRGVEHVGGSQKDDTLTGNSKINHLYGHGGADVLEGKGGNDLIEGGAGADSLVGGMGFDTVSYGASDAGVAVSLKDGSARGGHASKDISNHDTIEGFEAIVGSPHADTLTGAESRFNQLYGGDGADELRGAGGDIVLVGGDGADVLDGGAGWGTAAYWGSPEGVTVSLVAGAMQTGGDAAGDTLSRIDQVDGSGNNDALTGNSQNNVLNGHDGADMLRGGGGADRLTGGNGADTLYGEGGNDRLEGGAGQDSLYGGADNDILEGDAGEDVLRGGIGRDVIKGGPEEDELHGDGGKDDLYGGAGSDELSGGDEDDRLDGGPGADKLNGGPGADTFVFAAPADSPAGAPDTIEDFNQNEVDEGEEEGDVIELSFAAAGAEFIGERAFSGNPAGQVRYEQQGAVTNVLVDTDGNTTPDFVVTLVGTYDLTTNDFLGFSSS